jgi:hypothetical protein
MPTTPYACTQDATAINNPNGSGYSADWNATGWHSPIGVSADGNYVWRARMQFTSFSTTGITNVTNATLTTYYYHSGTSTKNAANSGNSTNRTIRVYLANGNTITDTGGGTPFPASGWVTKSGYNWETQFAGGTYLTTPMAQETLSGVISNGQQIDIDVTSLIQYVISNPSFTFRGFLLRIDDEAAGSTSSFAQLNARTNEAGSTNTLAPVLNVTYNSNTAPNAPTNLSPNSGTVVTAKTLTGTFSDPDAGDSMSSVQVQIASDSGFASIIYDSGTVSSSGSTFSVTHTAALTYNTTYYWRARTKDAAGLWGPYSAGDTFKQNTKPNTPTGLTPTGGATVTGLTPTFSGTASDPDAGDSIATARIKVYRSSDNVLMWDSGDFASGVASFTKQYGSGGTTYFNLSYGTSYYWIASVKDTNSSSSSNSSSSTFATDVAGVTGMTPNTSNASTGWVKTLTPSFNFVTPANMNQYTLKLYDTNNTLIRTIGPTAVSPVSTTLSSAYTYSGSPAIEWGTRYQWTVTWRDESLVTQPESPKAIFWTNAAPVANNISPANNQAITSTNPEISIGFADQDLANGNTDAPTKLTIEVSRASDSVVMYKMEKSSSLSSVSNALSQAASGVTSTSPATVTGVTAAGGTVTYTCSAGHPFVAGQVVTMTGINPVAYNLVSATILGSANAPTATTFKVTNGATGTFVSGGTATFTGTTALVKNTQYRYRAQYIDSSGSGSNTGSYSDYVFFKPTDGPTISSLAISASDLTTGKINNPIPEITYTFTGAFGKSQLSRRLRVIETSAANAVRFDSGFTLTSNSTLDAPVDIILNNATYKFEVTVRDTDEVESTTASVTYLALWNAPAVITGLEVEQGNGTLKLTWDQSSDASFKKYNIYRRDYGSSDPYTLLTNVSDIAVITYTDFSAGIGARYEYKITQTSQPVGSNAVDSDIDATEVVVASSTSDNWWIVSKYDESINVELYVDSEDRTNPYQEEVFEPFGRGKKVVVRYAQYGVEGNISAYIPNDETVIKMPNIRKLFEENVNSPIYLKTPFGDVYTVYFGTPSYQYATAGTVKMSVGYIEVE